MTSQRTHAAAPLAGNRAPDSSHMGMRTQVHDRVEALGGVHAPRDQEPERAEAGAAEATVSIAAVAASSEPADSGTPASGAEQQKQQRLRQTASVGAADAPCP
jgi:hypothetical protein